MKGRKGDWMQTFTGVAFYPLDPRAEDVRLQDIAHSLAHQCRYNGHCRAFYSVAQHSVLVSDWLRAHGRSELEVWGLLHDAAEAYTGDIVRPIKRSLPAVAAMEEPVERAISERFRLIWPMPAEVKRADNAVLLAEARDLMGPPPQPWSDRGEEPWPSAITPWAPEEARKIFLQVAARLGVY